MKGYQALPKERCGNCKHFCQHYGREDWGEYYPMWFGHCTHPRLKNRRVDEHCQHFTAVHGEQLDEGGAD